MTRNEIAKAIGFIPFELWRCVAVAENVKQMRGCANLWEPGPKHACLTRRTGRSTEMMLEALVEVSEGREVWIAGWEQSWEEKMVRQVRMWADKLGLDPKLVKPHRRRPRGPGRDEDNKGVYVDHYMGPSSMADWRPSP